jgi:hypothetical protein
MSRTVPVLWATAVDADHAFTDRAMARGMAGNPYEALCGVVVRLKPMICPPMPVCPRCVGLTRPTPPPQRGPGALARLVRRFTSTPAGAGDPDPAPAGHHRRVVS